MAREKKAHQTSLMQVVVSDRSASHQAAKAAHRLASELLESGRAEHIKIEVSLLSDGAGWPMDLLRFYRGFVLPNISSQVSLLGVRYMPDAWHELLKSQALAEEFSHADGVMLGVAIRQTGRRVSMSTQGAGAAAAYDFVEWAMAHAATEFGVVFPLRPGEPIDAPLRFDELTQPVKQRRIAR